jgi:hypothetical protein
MNGIDYGLDMNKIYIHLSNECSQTQQKNIGLIWWYMPAIPAAQEADIRKIDFQSQPRQKVPETPSQQTKQVVIHACNSSYEGAVATKIVVQGWLGVESMRCYL